MVAIWFVFASGCSLGPKRIRTDWRQYNQSVVDIESQELLLNLVRLRYSEYPGVLQVASITSQRNWSTSGAVGGTVPEGGPDTLSLGLSGIKSERPTVSFLPGGKEMVAAAVTPLTLDMLYLVAYMGWPASTSWPLMIKSINGVRNSPSGGGPIPSNTPNFGEFLEVAINLRLLQDQELVEVGRIEKLVPINKRVKFDSVTGADNLAAAESGYLFHDSEDADELILSKRKQVPVLRFAAAAIGTTEHDNIVRLLNLDPNTLAFEMEPAYEGNLKESTEYREDIEIGLRSIFEMLFMLSRGVQVPRCDLVNVPALSSDVETEWQSILGGFKVRSCDEIPACASVAVEYRDSWFYIDSRDHDSKSTFFLLKLIFDTQIQGGGAENLPVLTLPL
jgi:hypothetical protein